MKVFTGCTVVLEFETTTSYKDKTQWRKKITENGGIISFVLTKKASFLVVFNKTSTGCAYKIKQSCRYNIPVVSPKYVDQCLNRKRLLESDKFRLTDINSDLGFKKGKIKDPSSSNGVLKRRKRKKVIVDLGRHTSWLYGDLDAPIFDEDKFELPKWALLVDKDMTKLQVMEVHVATGKLLGTNMRYRLYSQTGEIQNKKVTKMEDAITWFFNTVEEVVSGYEQLYRRYTTSPLNMGICKPGDVHIVNFGSNTFRLILGKLSLLNEKISPQVAALTEKIWNEALEEVDSLLEVPMKYIQAKQIDEARVVLRQLADKLVTVGDNADNQEMTSYYDQFYEALPHKPEYRTTDWSLRNVVAKQDLCQLLSDIISVSEATDWSPDATIIAKYRALGCHVSHMDQSMDDFAQVKNMFECGDTPQYTIHNVFRIRRTMEEVTFLSDIGEIRLLTHGSAWYNCLGILSRGLLLPNIVQDKLGVLRIDSGNLGAGIYFSDSASKSNQFSSPCRQTGTRLMLLCDVALGQMYAETQSDSTYTAPPEGYDSVHGIKAVEGQTSFFRDNEFAIYNPNQQCVKYLVEFSLPTDHIKNDMLTTDVTSDIKPDIQVVDGVCNDVLKTKQTTNIDISDLKNVSDPLAKVKAGLLGSGKEHVPLKSVHIRAKMMDMVAKVNVLQAYRNDNKKTIEAKYVFPLDDTAAVCGFEAFINGKHIIGEILEKPKARNKYKEAVAKGHGAYLMEEETPDVFSVSVGNLPPHCDVLIKITYIAELQVDSSAICFQLPAAVAPWLKHSALAQSTQSTTDSVKVTNNKKCDLSLHVSMEMASDIRKIYSPTHTIKYKKTATKAVVALPKKCNLDNGFQLNVHLAEIHVPRMWVERHPESNTQACMLTFYPEFESEADPEPDILILLDMSNSMKGETEMEAKKVTLLAVDNLPVTCLFNIISFGSTFKELFPSAQKSSKFSLEIARSFIQDCSATLGSTDVWDPLHAAHILSPSNSHMQNLFLISDGHVTQESLVVKATRIASQKSRVFTLGVGSSLNQHLLRNLTSVGGGTYQYYSSDVKSQWQRKIVSQIEKACQPGLTDVHVDWLQTNENVIPPVQAPNQIPCLFSGCRQVVYGFVESCMQATLKACVNGQEVSTMVSTVDLNVTTGTMLHQLAARAVITDYETGVLDDDRIKHQILKTEKKQYIIDLSKKFCIVTPYTSFVAVEERNKAEIVNKDGPSVSDLVAKETVDILPYMDWEPNNFDDENDPRTSVIELIRRGQIAETFSMMQAEEIYGQLEDHLDFIIKNKEMADKVYDCLGSFYKQNQAAVVGNIISQIEPVIKRNEVDFRKKRRISYAYTETTTDLPKSNFFENAAVERIVSIPHKKHKKFLIKKSYIPYDGDGSGYMDRNRDRERNRDRGSDRDRDRERTIVSPPSRSCFDECPISIDDKNSKGKSITDFEANLPKSGESNALDLDILDHCISYPALMPPEIVWNPDDEALMEECLKEAASMPLPSDDDSLWGDSPNKSISIREHSNKYLKGLVFNSAIYDPKTRVMQTDTFQENNTKQVANGSDEKDIEDYFGKRIIADNSKSKKQGRLYPKSSGKQLATKAARKSAPVTCLSEMSDSGSDSDKYSSDADKLLRKVSCSATGGKKKVDYEKSYKLGEDIYLDESMEIDVDENGDGGIEDVVEEKEEDEEEKSILIAHRLSSINEKDNKLTNVVSLNGAVELPTETSSVTHEVLVSPPEIRKPICVSPERFDQFITTVPPTSLGYTKLSQSIQSSTVFFGNFDPMSLSHNFPSQSYQQSPVMYNLAASSYSPAAPSYSSALPSYMPAAPSCSLAAPSYNPAAHSYSPAAPSYNPAAPSYSPVAPSYNAAAHSYRSAVPSYKPAVSYFSPVAPTYSPATPSFQPASQSYDFLPQSYQQTLPCYGPTSPSYSPTSPSYSPISPSYGARKTTKKGSYYLLRSRSRSISRTRPFSGDRKANSSSTHKTRGSRNRSGRGRKRSKSSTRKLENTSETTHTTAVIKRSRSLSRDRKGRFRSRSNSRLRQSRRSRSGSELRSHNRKRRSKCRSRSRSQNYIQGSENKTRRHRYRRSRSGSLDLSRSRSRDQSVSRSTEKRRIVSPVVLSRGSRKTEKLKKTSYNNKEREEKTEPKTKLIRNTKSGRWERKVVQEEVPIFLADEAEHSSSDSADDVCPRSVDKENIWSSLRVLPVDLQLNKYDEVHGLLQSLTNELVEDEEQSLRLTGSLRSVCGLCKSELTEVLHNQGTHSLGRKMTFLVERIVSILIVIIVVAKQIYRRRNNKCLKINLSTDIKYHVEEKSVSLFIDGDNINMPDMFVPAFHWLEKQEKSLPPLYRTLEMGKTKMDFICQLAAIFDDI